MQQLKKCILYIGANNQTGKVETDKITEILDNSFDGYNYLPSKGRWQGTNEDSLNVFIATAEPIKKIKTVCETLKDKLSQESILIEYGTEIHFV